MEWKKKWWLLPLGSAAALTAAGLPYKTDITHYELYSPKIKTPVTAVLLSDLHNDAGTARRKSLVKKIRALNPDLILMPGDMAEEKNHQDNTVALLYDLKGIPMFFSTGNHEEYRWDLTSLMRRFMDCGVTPLRNESTVFSVNGNDLEIAGISCRYKMEQFTPEEVNGLFHTDNCRILLTHKPNWLDLYKDIHADYFLCGHAHGGQWHIPGTEIGIAAPSQGFFPKYISGIHKVGEGEMVIGRGLVRHYHGITRLYNNPEIVVLHLNPAQK